MLVVVLRRQPKARLLQQHEFGRCRSVQQRARCTVAAQPPRRGRWVGAEFGLNLSGMKLAIA
jgi:hypothetical protein